MLASVLRSRVSLFKAKRLTSLVNVLGSYILMLPGRNNFAMLQIDKDAVVVTSECFERSAGVLYGTICDKYTRLHVADAMLAIREGQLDKAIRACETVSFHNEGVKLLEIILQLSIDSDIGRAKKYVDEVVSHLTSCSRFNGLARLNANTLGVVSGDSNSVANLMNSQVVDPEEFGQGMPILRMHQALQTEDDKKKIALYKKAQTDFALYGNRMLQDVASRELAEAQKRIEIDIMQSRNFNAFVRRK